MRKLSLLLLIILLILPGVLVAREDALLYRTSDYFNPITYYFNASFDVVQNPYWFSQDHYWHNHKELFRRIGSPGHSIEKDGGWKKLWQDEFTSSRVFPNIALHTVGSGYDFRYIHEYFEENDYPLPWVFSVGLVYLGHLGNESYELSSSNVSGHDHIADLFFFDPLGILLFSNSQITQFFRDEMAMENWSYIPFIDVEEFDVHNAGLNYIFRPDFFKSNLRPFLFLGMQAMGGLSYQVESGSFITFSSGVAFTDPLKQKYRWANALFYDSDRSLAASLIVNGSEDYRVRVNLYPEVFGDGKWKLGVMSGLERTNDVALGVNLNMPVGIGIY